MLHKNQQNDANITIKIDTNVKIMLTLCTNGVTSTLTIKTAMHKKIDRTMQMVQM